jgi:hypothetical protein
MKHRSSCGLTLLAAAAGLFVRPAAAEFTVVVLPDTQYYTWVENIFYQQFGPAIFHSQTQWIVDNRVNENIAFVIHEGDITQLNNHTQWQIADSAMSTLDGKVPYILSVGNHDMGPNGSALNRDTTLYNLYFPASRFEKEPWYGGRMPNDGNDNYYVLFSAEGMDFMIISLEFGPTAAMIQWANGVVAAHPDRRVIVVTHCYTNFDDTRVGPGDNWNPHGYGINNTGPHDGEEMWEAFVKHHANIFLVVSGHILDDGAGRLSTPGVHGNIVHQVLANYQTPIQPNAGNGFLRLLRFKPQENRIDVRTYSPWLNQYLNDPQQQFTLDYPMTDPSQATLRIRRPAHCLNANDLVNVTVWVTNVAPETAVATYELSLQYNSKQLTFVGGTYSDAAFGTPTVLPIQPNGSNIPLAAGVNSVAGQSWVTSDALLATLTFRMNQSGHAPDVSFSDPAPPTVMTDPLGQNIILSHVVSDAARGDLNLDGRINGLDLGILLGSWSIPMGAPGCLGTLACLPDINCDGVVNGLDLGIQLANWSIP